MKKLVVILVLSVLLQTGFAGYERLDINEGKEAEKIEELVGSDSISGYLMQAGYPVLPYIIKTYEFPAGTKIEVNVKAINITEEKASIIKIAAPPKIDGFENIGLNYEIAKFDVYPEKWYDYSIGVGRNKQGKIVEFLTIYLYPQRINKDGIMLRSNEFDIKIRYEIPSKPLFTNEEYDLLIICPKQWENIIQPLIKHKESHGIKTMVKTVENIVSSYSGRDDAEKVKYAIKDAIEQYGIKYVLLFGGRKPGVKERWYVPVRYSHLDDNSNWEASYLSDLYFADVYKYEDGQPVFEDWDSNGNGIFAEWRMAGKDYLDLYPDVYVGRLACRNKAEVKIMIDKIITYEDFPFNEFYKFILVAGDSYNDSHGYIEGELATWEAYKQLEGFEAVKVWASEVDLSAENIINAMNDGAGFAYFCGHGNPMSWSTHEPYNFDEWEEGLQIFDMPLLENGYKLPIVVIGGCHNSQFNVTIFNSFNKEKLWKGENAPECWSWWLTRKINGGAIATIGNTGLGYHGSEDSNEDGIADYLQVLDGWLEINFFRLYNEGIDMLGMLHATTLTGFINTFPGNEKMPLTDVIDIKVTQEWCLLGDPSLKIGGYD
ncbi:MAG: peptidase C25 [Thermoplasmata archaeon]|nr:MAG: peptidase C25 [Thermoplasmata archaeon]